MTTTMRVMGIGMTTITMTKTTKLITPYWPVSVLWPQLNTQYSHGVVALLPRLAGLDVHVVLSGEGPVRSRYLGGRWPLPQRPIKSVGAVLLHLAQGRRASARLEVAQENVLWMDDKGFCLVCFTS